MRNRKITAMKFRGVCVFLQGERASGSIGCWDWIVLSCNEDFRHEIFIFGPLFFIDFQGAFSC